MPPDSPNAAPGGPGVQNQPGVGAQAPNTGVPAPSANQAADVQRIVTEAVTAAMAPIVELVKHSANAGSAARRVNSRQSDDPGGTAAPDQLSDEALEKLSKPELLAVVRTTHGRVAELERRDSERRSTEEKRSLDDALNGAITKGGFANADLMRMALRPNLKRDAQGKAVVDDGSGVKTLDEAIAALGARPEFRPAPAGQGAGAQNQGHAGSGGTPAAAAPTADEISAMTPEQFRAYKAKFFAGGGLIR